MVSWWIVDTPYPWIHCLKGCLLRTGLPGVLTHHSGSVGEQGSHSAITTAGMASLLGALLLIIILPSTILSVMTIQYCFYDIRAVVGFLATKP